MCSERVQTPSPSFPGSLPSYFNLLEKEKYADSCIFPPAAAIAFTRSAERKQSGYCVPLEWPAPIQTAPTPPTMTTRGTDVRCCCCCRRRCCCTRASAILWSPRVVPLSVFNLPALVHVMSKTISCLISEKVITALELWVWRDAARLPLSPEAQGCALAGDHHLSPCLFFMYPCTFNQQWDVDHGFVWFLALSFSRFGGAAYCSLGQWHLWCIAVGWTGAVSMRYGLLAHLCIEGPTNTHPSPGATFSPSIRRTNPTFHYISAGPWPPIQGRSHLLCAQCCSWIQRFPHLVSLYTNTCSVVVMEKYWVLTKLSSSTEWFLKKRII